MWRLLLPRAARYFTVMMTRRVLPVGFIGRCIPTLAAKPPSGPGWVHEIKHDGYRLIVRRDGETVRLFTRRGYDWTERYPAIAAAAVPLGSTESIMMAHGFESGTLHALVSNGLATTERRTVRAGHRRIEVTWLTITDAGRRALGG